MKPSDFCPRAAFLDTVLTGSDLTGVEVGCDVGAHAEALLRYCSIKHLTLIDLFANEWCEGYCFGRLKEWRHKILILKGKSNEIVKRLGRFDFIYIDIAHDPQTVLESLNDWWPVLKPGGVMGYRNYSTCKETIDAWLQGKKFEVDGYHNEIVIYK